MITFKKNLENKNSDPIVAYSHVLNALGIFLTNIEDFPLVLPKVEIYHETNSIPIL